MSRKIILVLFLLSGQLLAQVNINGYLRTYNRFRLQQKGKISWNDNTLDLKFEGTPSQDVHFYSEVRLRSFGFPNVQQSADLQRREKDLVQPWGLEFREAYVDLYGFLSENLDLRIGRQRIAWGTADKFNPTDNLNPDDLEDIFNFGRHLGSNAIMATYYLTDITFYGIYIPVFTPATMPFGDWARAFEPSLNLPSGVPIASFQDHISLPPNKLSATSSFAFKVAGNLFNYDWSLSYFNGRDDLPLISEILLNFGNTGNYYDATINMTYPKMQVVGADLAGAIGSVGVWAEGALFLPQKQYLYTSTQLPNMGPRPLYRTNKEVILDNKPYFKFVVGGDYTFKNGWYVNGQFLHGFLHERGRENLNDYILVRIEKKFLHDALKIVPLGIALSINDWQQLKNQYGVAGGPEIEYAPADGLQIAVGAYIIDGQGDNLFSKVKDFDEAYFKVTYSF